MSCMIIKLGFFIALCVMIVHGCRHLEAENSCELDEELERLVHQNTTRTKLFMLCHDEHSEHVSRKFIRCKESWMEPIMLNLSAFFETSMYKDVFPKHAAEWNTSDIDYVMTATYKTVHKLKLHEGIYYQQDLSEIKKMLQIARDGDYDFVPFLRSHTGLIDSILYWHGPSFKVAWDALLLKLGYSIETVRKFDQAKPFYRNIFIAKPSVLLKLSDMMVRAMRVVKHEPDVAKLFEIDAKYAGGKEEVAVKVFGTRYYHLHPFIFERLPAFFLYEMGAKVCMNKPNQGPCPYNY